MQPSQDPPVATADAEVGAEVEVDALLVGMDRLDERPLTEHVDVFEQVHGRLQAALREIDNA